MSINPDKRKCSAVRSDGHPCQAWAVIDSDPPLCPAHAGLQTGAGAPIGNRNAMKHGLYMTALQPEDIVDIDLITSKSLVHELVLMRAALRRLGKYLNDEAVPMKDKLAVLPAAASLVRTIIQLQSNIGDSFDWDEVLDDLGKDWGIEI